MIPMQFRLNPTIRPPLSYHAIKKSNMSADQKYGLKSLARWLLTTLVTISSPMVTAQSAVVTRSDHLGEQNKSYRNIGNAGLSDPLSRFMTLPVDTCAIVDHIERISITNEVNSNPDARIMGTIVQPTGRHANKAFYTSVDIPANQGYYPPQRNIAKTDHFRISLTTLDGNLHIVTQPTSPRFMPGDTVLFRNSGTLETADCARQPSSK